MRFGAVIPYATEREFTELAVIAERAGWDQVFSWEAVWAREPRFRHIWRVATVMWGVVTLLDAVTESPSDMWMIVPTATDGLLFSSLAGLPHG